MFRHAKVAKRMLALFSACFSLSVGWSSAQQTPMVIAWQAPTDETTMCGLTTTCYQNFVNNELPSISGIGAVLLWSSIDHCGSVPCSGDTMNCPHSSDYQWCTLDQVMTDYMMAVPNKKIVLIVYPENDSPDINTRTPQYVFSSAWAASQNSDPQDVVACSGWKGDITASTSPVYLIGSGFSSMDFAVWNVNSCTTGASPNLACRACTGTCSDFTGFPVVYEKPIVAAYQGFISSLVKHYSPMGSGLGPGLAQYIAYMRVGMSAGGEDLPYCAVAGPISAASWSSSTPVTAGFQVLASGNLYVATGGGITGLLAPSWCSTAGCTTTTDGTVHGWYNTGSRGTGSNTNRVWPGPLGQASEPVAYSDNGYLSTWGSTDGSGYITAMATFLHSLPAGFPITIAAHTGPPNNNNTSYADSEAIIASYNSIGFGMQAASVGDMQLYAAGTYPTSKTDWVHNFATYPAPVHHLQTADPGTTTFAAGFSINYITLVAGGQATVNCNNDCSPFGGLSIVVTGNSNPSLNGVWLSQCVVSGGSCVSGELQFNTGLSCASSCNYSGGNVFAPDYWPMLMPFAVQRGATSVEVWECTLDYAFGTSTFPSGCATGGLLGADSSYQGALSNRLLGLPLYTHSLLRGYLLGTGYEY